MNESVSRDRPASSDAWTPAGSPEPVRIESEVGRLRSVVVHTPGREIESMTPRTANEVLYNDIIPLSVVSGEHRTLRRVLSLVANVYELSDLLERALAAPDARESLARSICRTEGSSRRLDEVLALDAPGFVRTVIAGLESRGDTFTDALLGRQYDLPPLPNLYFMRDSSLVIRDRVVVGAMTHAVRSTEAQLLGAVFASREGVPNAGVLFDGRTARGPDVRLEGGDVLVVRRDLLVVGISERTSSRALDELARSLADVYLAPAASRSGDESASRSDRGAARDRLTLLAVSLPCERSTIHLDMIFTLVDVATALVYEPYVIGPRRVDVHRMDIVAGGSTHVTKCDGLVDALRELGVDLATIACGGGDPVVREREQWLSAANAFAIAPGVAIGYDCNVATMDAFSAAGYEVRAAEELLSGACAIDDFRRLFIGIPGINLARGGGGPRCMTLPLSRDPL